MKKRKVFSAIFASVLSVSCLCGAFSASAEKVVSTIDENGVIHTRIEREKAGECTYIGTYDPKFSNILEEKMYGVSWLATVYPKTEEERETIKQYFEGRYSGWEWNQAEDGTYPYTLDFIWDASGESRGMTKEEAEAAAAEILQKKLMDHVTVGERCDTYTSLQNYPTGTVYVYGDHDFTESDFAWLDQDKNTLEISGSKAAIVNQELNLKDQEYWTRNYQLMCSALEKMEHVGVQYQSHVYRAVYSFHQHEGDAYDAHETGDIDNNSAVDARDAAAVLTYAAKQGAGMDGTLSGGEAPAEAAAFAAADVNGDGAVNAADAAMILQYSAQEGAGMAPDWA